MTCQKARRSIPVLACAVGWTLPRLRTREAGDRFVLCLPLLSLDELWLQQICSGHDYYLYYLAPFAAVAAAPAMLAMRRPLTAVIAVAMLIQTGAVLCHRMTKKLPSETDYRLGTAIREVVPPGDKVFSLVYVMPATTSYYADRRIEYYHPSGHVDVHPTVPWRKVELEAFLRSNPEGYDWVVAAEREAVADAVGYFRTMRRAMTPDAYDREMRYYGVEILPSPVLERLNRIAVDRIDRGGFVFFRLRKR